MNLYELLRTVGTNQSTALYPFSGLRVISSCMDVYVNKISVDCIFYIARIDGVKSMSTSKGAGIRKRKHPS